MTGVTQFREQQGFFKLLGRSSHVFSGFCVTPVTKKVALSLGSTQLLLLGVMLLLAMGCSQLSEKTGAMGVECKHLTCQYMPSHASSCPYKNKKKKKSKADTTQQTVPKTAVVVTQDDEKVAENQTDEKAAGGQAGFSLAHLCNASTVVRTASSTRQQLDDIASGPGALATIAQMLYTSVSHKATTANALAAHVLKNYAALCLEKNELDALATAAYTVLSRREGYSNPYYFNNTGQQLLDVIARSGIGLPPQQLKLFFEKALSASQLGQAQVSLLTAASPEKMEKLLEEACQSGACVVPLIYDSIAHNRTASPKIYYSTLLWESNKKAYYERHENGQIPAVCLKELVGRMDRDSKNGGAKVSLKALEKTSLKEARWKISQHYAEILKEANLLPHRFMALAIKKG